MRLFTVVFTMIIITVLFGTILNKVKIIDQLENQLENQLEQTNFQIDSLKQEIDTLQKESEIWDFNFSFDTKLLISSIISVESGSNDSAYRASEGAVGCLQIRKTMVNDINRILKIKNTTLRFTYNDRWLRHKSIQIFDIYCKHYKLTTAEEIARCWNGGPRGMNNPLTINYWKKVKENLDS